MTAVFSPCRRYRYRLERELGALASTRGAVAFVGLNPSTADETVDDPTIRRCMRFARDWGFRRLVMANAYAWRSTDPAGLWTALDPVGPDNDAHLEAIAGDVELVVVAWGKHARPDRVTARPTLYSCACPAEHAAFGELVRRLWDRHTGAAPGLGEEPLEEP